MKIATNLIYDSTEDSRFYIYKGNIERRARNRPTDEQYQAIQLKYKLMGVSIDELAGEYELTSEYIREIVNSRAKPKLNTQVDR